MSYSPPSPSSSDDNPWDPRYKEWDEKSRTKLRERLEEAVDRRTAMVQQLIPQRIKQLISDNAHELNIDVDDSVFTLHFEAILMQQIHHEISQQIAKWKGLRWWKFNESVTSWNEWYKKAKCWQDQNQHKPLGRFWCFILDQLKKYTLSVSQSIFPVDAAKRQALDKCLYITCVLAVFTGSVRFERTRETPLLPVRTLTQSKEFQHKLKSVDSGFTLSLWKEEAEREHKRQKKGKRDGDTKQRGNIATLLNKKCCKHAQNVYRRCYTRLKGMIPSLNSTDVTWNDMNDSDSCDGNGKEEEDESVLLSAPTMPHSDTVQSENGYHPTRGYGSNVSPCESQRFSPMMVSDAATFDARSAIYTGDRRHASRALLVENYYLRGELERMTTRYLDMMKRYNSPYNLSLSRIASPMRVNVANTGGNNTHYATSLPPEVSMDIPLLNEMNLVNNTVPPAGIYSDVLHGELSPIPFAFHDSF